MSAATPQNPKKHKKPDGTSSLTPEEEHNQDLHDAANMGYRAGQQKAQEAYDAGKEKGADEATQFIAEQQRAKIEQMQAEQARIAQQAAELQRAQEEFARQKQAFEARKASSQQQEPAEHAESGAAGMGMTDDGDEATSAAGKSSSATGKSSNATGRSSAATGGKGSRGHHGPRSSATGASGRGGGRFKPAGPARTGDEAVIEALMEHLKLNPQQSDPLERNPESRCVQWGYHGYPVTEDRLMEMIKGKLRPVLCRGQWQDDEFVPTALYIVHSVDTQDRINDWNVRDVRTWVKVQRVEWYNIGWQDPSSGGKMYLDNQGTIEWPLLKHKIVPESFSVLLTKLHIFCGTVAGRVGFAPITGDDELKITFPSPDDGQKFVDDRMGLQMTMWEGIAWTQRGDHWYTIEYGTKDGDIWWTQYADRTWWCLRNGVWATRDEKGNWHANQ